MVHREETMRTTPGIPPDPMNAYISASSRGLAFEIARTLAVGGANVALSGRSAARLGAARAMILAQAPGVRALTVSGDLSNIEDQDRNLRGPRLQ